jgi:D-alanine-D-alanine ligase
MKFLVICDVRENLKNRSVNINEKTFNDHPHTQNLHEIMSCINKVGYYCEYFGGIPELVHSVDLKLRFPDTFFLNFTDGLDQQYSRVQAPVLMDMLEVPYSGSSVFAASIMNNKQYSKYAIQDLDIYLPKSTIVNGVFPLSKDSMHDISYPCIVKPNCEGSSLGISKENVCHGYNDLQDRTKHLLKDFSELIIEEYIVGQDVTDFIIGNPGAYLINDVISFQLHDTSPYAVYEAEAKTLKKRDLFWNNEQLPIDLVSQIQKVSTQIFEQLNASDVIRIDYRIEANTQKIFFLEANSMPRFSTTSEIGFICVKRNIDFVTALDYYIQSALKRYDLFNRVHKLKTMDQNQHTFHIGE